LWMWMWMWMWMLLPMSLVLPLAVAVRVRLVLVLAFELELAWASIWVFRLVDRCCCSVPWLAYRFAPAIADVECGKAYNYLYQSFVND